MKGIRQGLQIRRRAEVRVDLVDVLRPVAMIRLAIRAVPRKVLYYWRDPDLWIISTNLVSSIMALPRAVRIKLRDGDGMTYGSKPHAMDIIQLVNHALPAAPAVDAIRRVARRGRRAIGAREPVRQELVDGLRAPFRRGQRGGGAHGTQEAEGGGEMHADGRCSTVLPWHWDTSQSGTRGSYKTEEG
jgi:hypothetical protein